MRKLSHQEFTEAPADYLICSCAEAGTDVSCVIVEDDPGPYLGFVQDIVESGVASLAMTAPFSDQTLSLLRGMDVQFGSGKQMAKTRLPNPAHCVLILDMRNGTAESTEQIFQGYDPANFALAGYHFFKQLRGFPGKIFFATRYGRELLAAKGITGAFGVVPLELKADYSGPMDERDKQKLMTAVDLALVQCDVAQIYSIGRRGDFIDMTYAGEVCTIPPGPDGPSKPALAFMALVKAGPQGLSDEKLAKGVGYKPRNMAHHAPDPDVLVEETPSANETAGALLPKVLELLKDGRIKGMDYSAVCIKVGFDPDSSASADAAEMLKQIVGLMMEVNEKFTYDDLYTLLCSETPAQTESKLDHSEQDSMSEFDEKGMPETVTRSEKASSIKNYWKLNFEEIPSRQAVIWDLKKDVGELKAGALRGVVQSAKKENRLDASYRKKAVSSTGADLTQKIQQLSDEVVRLGKIRDQYFRMGILSAPIRDKSGVITGYLVAAPESNVSGAVRKYRGRLLDTLRDKCDPVPEALIVHIESHWNCNGGTQYYTGNKTWQA